MNTLSSAWDLFRTTVIPHDASPTQIQEMRRAFYAGAASFLDIQMRMADDNVSEDAACAVMDTIHGELMEFGANVAKGKR